MYIYMYICVCFQEKDFEFAGEHRAAYADDEDFVSDQEGSGEIEGSAQGPGNYSPLHLQPQIRMFFWSSGIIDCLLFTFENRVLLMR